MRLDTLDWNLLRTFYVIVEASSLTRAAAELQISQPSVSAALQRLETALGSVLITRTGRRFELTRQGEQLYNECSQIFLHVMRINDKLSESSRDITGTVKILAVTDVRFPAFDLALAEMHRRHPQVVVYLETVSSPQAVRAVSRQVAPIALSLLPQPIAGLDCELLEREEFGIFCGPAHPLYGRAEVGIEELRASSMVSFACYNEGGTLEPMLALGIGAGLGERIRGSSAHLGEVVRLVRAGYGIGILPVASVVDQVLKGDLWRLHPPDVELGANLYLVSNPAMPLDRATAGFLKLFRKIIRDDSRATLPHGAGR